jgi:ornithine cyclodeaminase/alanine dehydrogenase-like protein (mu-crystallin family)
MNASAHRPAPVLLLDQATVSALITPDDCIAAVESAFAAHALGRTLAPELMHLDAEGGEFHIKAGGLRSGWRSGTGCYVTCKINGGFFGNRAALGLPNIIGLILLSDGATGSPLAVMESGYITRLRTGAATAVAARYLARANSTTVTLCGAGSQGEMQLRCLARCLPIERVCVWSRGGSAVFSERMAGELKLDIKPVRDLAAATRDSDVIVTSTPSTAWFLGAQHVRPGTFVAAIGADSPAKQELEPELVANSSVVCDIAAQCAEVGDLHHAIAAGLMTAADIRGELGAVIAGLAPKRLRADETIIFDSTGTALQDAAAAILVYERAKALGRGESFAFWS